YLRIDKQTPEVAPNVLLYVLEGILLISTIIFMFNSHWIISVLLVFYIVFIHVQYMRFKMAGTIYHFLLSVFFNGFMMNVIAFRSHTFPAPQLLLIDIVRSCLVFIDWNVLV